MIRRFGVLLRLEALTLLRMSEAYTFGVLPAVLSLPLMLAGVTLFLSFQRDPTLAVPKEDPAGFALGDRLDDDWKLLRSDDPAADVREGRADAAVTRWAEGPADGAWLEVDAVVPDADAREKLSGVLDRAVTRAQDAKIREAGGAPATDRRVGRVSRATLASGVDALSPRFAFVAFASFLAGYLGCFVVPVRTTVERLSGALEAMSVTATPLALLYAARVVVSAAYCELVVLMPIGTAALLILGSGGDVPSIPPLDLVELFAALLLFNAVFVWCGLAANSLRTALYLASYAILLALPVYALPFWGAFRWVPVVGLAAEVGVGWQLARIGLGVAVAALAVVVAGFAARLDRQVPTAGAGE